MPQQGPSWRPDLFAIRRWGAFGLIGGAAVGTLGLIKASAAGGSLGVIPAFKAAAAALTASHGLGWLVAGGAAIAPWLAVPGIIAGVLIFMYGENRFGSSKLRGSAFAVLSSLAFLSLFIPPLAPLLPIGGAAGGALIGAGLNLVKQMITNRGPG